MAESIAVVAEDDLERALRENAELRSENVRLQDLLLQARRRIRVLRGNDVLTSASSRGVVIWLNAIHEGTDHVATRRHLRALIETLAGEDNAHG